LTQPTAGEDGQDDHKALARDLIEARNRELGFRVMDALACLYQASSQEICDYTGMSRYEFTKIALPYAKDILAQYKEEPIAYIRGKYQLAVELSEVKEYLAPAIRGMVTHIRRMRSGSLTPALKKFGDSETIRRLTKDLRRVEEDLTDLLATF
jgi:hypothetical protein